MSRRNGEGVAHILCVPAWVVRIQAVCEGGERTNVCVRGEGSLFSWGGGKRGYVGGRCESKCLWSEKGKK